MRTQRCFGYRGGGGGGGGGVGGGRVSVGSGIYLTFALFYTCCFSFINCLLVLYRSVLYVLANSRQWFILFSYDNLVLTLLVILKAL